MDKKSREGYDTSCKEEEKRLEEEKRSHNLIRMRASEKEKCMRVEVLMSNLINFVDMNCFEGKLIIYIIDITMIAL